MTAADIEIRTMRREEVDIAVEWAREEGWNPGIHDADAFWSADPDGFFIALSEDIPVGCISAVAYDERFAFGGFYIVRRDFRSRGVGMRLWKHALAYLGQRNMGGDGVMERLEDYAREGFRLAYSNVRFEGLAAGGTFGDVDCAREIPFEQLNEYDRRFFPARRERFLRKWIDQQDSKAVCTTTAGVITGFGVIRRCFVGHKVGPLFADSPAIAERLLLALTSELKGEVFFLDVPEPNAEGMKLAAKWEMKPVFKTGRIYNRGIPELPLHGIFGVTSFELG